jgi:hypothetical protein
VLFHAKPHSGYGFSLGLDAQFELSLHQPDQIVIEIDLLLEFSHLNWLQEVALGTLHIVSQLTLVELLLA